MNLTTRSGTLATRLRALLGVLAVTASISASAALVSENSSYGPDTLTLDTITNLEWLDLTLSTNLSINQVNARLGPGQQFAGFSLASNAQITTLFTDGGVTPPIFVSQAASDLANVNNLINLLGMTFTDFGGIIYGNFGLESDNNGFAGPAAYFAQLQIQIPGSSVCEPAGCADAVVPGGRFLPLSDGLNVQDPEIGSYLVRTSSTVPVPEPSSFVLLAAGLAVLGFSRRRKAESQ